MSTIEFPHQFDNYFRLGVDEFEQGHYDKALANLEEAYRLKPEMEVHRLIVLCYMQLEKYQEATQVFSERYTEYLATPEGIKLYFELLLKTKQWITAKILLIDHSDILYSLYDQLETLEEADMLTNQKAIKQKVKQLLAIGKLKPIEQLKLINQAFALPEKMFGELIPLLVDNKVHLAVRAHLLDAMRGLDWNFEIEYLDLTGSMQKVIPAEIPTMADSLEWQKFLGEVLILLEDLPELKPIVLEMLPMIFMFLLPDVDKMLQNGKKFAHVLVSDLLGQEVSAEDKEMLAVITKINQAMSLLDS